MFTLPKTRARMKGRNSRHVTTPRWNFMKAGHIRSLRPPDQNVEKWALVPFSTTKNICTRILDSMLHTLLHTASRDRPSDTIVLFSSILRPSRHCVFHLRPSTHLLGEEVRGECERKDGNGRETDWTGRRSHSVVVNVSHTSVPPWINNSPLNSPPFKGHTVILCFCVS
jgi:hypothetical protein